MKKIILVLALILFSTTLVFSMGAPQGYGRGGPAGGSIITFLPFIGIIILGLIILAVVGNRRGNNPSLILEEFNFNENEDEFLKINGRASGFWNWILSLFGKAPMTYLTFNKQILKYEDSGIKYNIPLLNVTSVSYGIVKSSVILLIIGIILIFFWGIGIILIIVWALNRKTLYYGIYVSENTPMIKIKMKRGMINSLDLNKFESSAKNLTEIVLKNASAK